MPYPVSQIYTVPVPNGSLTAANYNAEFQNVYLNVGKPENVDDFSENVAEMQIQTDPGEIGSENQPTSLSGELERIRFAIKEVKQKIDPTVTYWYQTPGNLNLGGVANTDTFTIYAQNDAFTETVLTLKSDTVAGTGYKFLEFISDANGTPSTRTTIDGSGNVVTLGNVTTTGLLTVLDIPGIKADKLILSEAGTGVNHITIQGPDSASTTTHVITLPGSLPAQASFMLIDQTGQVSYTVSPTIADLIGVQMTSVGANAVFTTANTATNANALIANVSTIPATQATLIASSFTQANANSILNTANLGDYNHTRVSGVNVAAPAYVMSLALPSAGTYLLGAALQFSTGDTNADVLYSEIIVAMHNGAGQAIPNPSGSPFSGYNSRLYDSGNTMQEWLMHPFYNLVFPYTASGPETVKIQATKGAGTQSASLDEGILWYMRIL